MLAPRLPRLRRPCEQVAASPVLPLEKSAGASRPCASPAIVSPLSARRGFLAWLDQPASVGSTILIVRASGSAPAQTSQVLLVVPGGAPMTIYEEGEEP